MPKFYIPAGRLTFFAYNSDRPVGQFRIEVDEDWSATAIFGPDCGNERRPLLISERAIKHFIRTEKWLQVDTI